MTGKECTIARYDFESSIAITATHNSVAHLQYLAAIPGVRKRGKWGVDAQVH